jgi:serine/threonine-protein kinase
MYRMLAGRLPFVTRDEREMVARQMLSRPPKPSRFDESIDEQLELVIMTAIQKRPELRYPSMQIFGRDLRQLARSEPGQATLWAQPRGYEPYALDSTSARFAATAFRDFLR